MPLKAVHIPGRYGIRFWPIPQLSFIALNSAHSPRRHQTHCRILSHQLPYCKGLMKKCFKRRVAVTAGCFLDMRML